MLLVLLSNLMHTINQYPKCHFLNVHILYTRYQDKSENSSCTEILVLQENRREGEKDKNRTSSFGSTTIHEVWKKGIHRIAKAKYLFAESDCLLNLLCIVTCSKQAQLLLVVERYVSE